MLFVASCAKKGTFGTPIGLLAFFNAVGLVGICGVAESMYSVDVIYARYMGFMAILTAVAASMWSLSARPATRRLNQVGLEPVAIDYRLIFLYVLCLALTISYYRAVGHVTLLQAITTSGNYDAASARLESYAGASYFAPGYINQFKNALLPALTFSFIHALWTRRVPGRLMISVALSVVAVVAVAGTGQRGALVIVLLSFVIALRAGGHLRGVSLAWMAALGFVLFSFTTYFNGRQKAEIDAASTIGDKFQIYAEALFDRVFREQAMSGIYGFRYTYGLPVPNGREWFTDILGILPAYRGSDLSNKIFATIYGSDRGTSPPSNWGGAYYNFGFAMSIGVALLILVIYALLSQRFYVSHSICRLNSLQMIGLAGFAVATGSWVAGSPLAILNQGALAFLFAYWLGGRCNKRGDTGREGVRRGRGRPSPSTVPQPVRRPRVLVRGVRAS